MAWDPKGTRIAVLYKNRAHQPVHVIRRDRPGEKIQDRPDQTVRPGAGRQYAEPKKHPPPAKTGRPIFFPRTAKRKDPPDHPMMCTMTSTRVWPSQQTRASSSPATALRLRPKPAIPYYPAITAIIFSSSPISAISRTEPDHAVVQPEVRQCPFTDAGTARTTSTFVEATRTGWATATRDSSPPKNRASIPWVLIQWRDHACNPSAKEVDSALRLYKKDRRGFDCRCFHFEDSAYTFPLTITRAPFAETRIAGDNNQVSK